MVRGRIDDFCVVTYFVYPWDWNIYDVKSWHTNRDGPHPKEWNDFTKSKKLRSWFTVLYILWTILVVVLNKTQLLVTPFFRYHIPIRFFRPFYTYIRRYLRTVPKFRDETTSNTRVSPLIYYLYLLDRVRYVLLQQVVPYLYRSPSL